MNRKPPPSAVLKTLDDDIQTEIFDAMQTLTLEQGVEWLAAEKGIKTNKTSLGDWRGWYEMRNEIGSWETDANDFKAMLIRTGTDDELAAKIAEARFLAQAAKKNDAETFVKVMGVIEKYKARKAGEKAHADKMQLEDKKMKRKDRSLDQAQQKIAQQDRKIALLEAKLKEADDVAQDGTLTPEDKALRWKQIFGR